MLLSVSLISQNNAANPADAHEIFYSVDSLRLLNLSLTFSEPELPASRLLPFAPIFQSPELPNGCEATSLASVLQYYGFDADKLSLASDYIPHTDFTQDESGTRFGADPEEAYAGAADGIGYYCYAAPLIQGANAYLAQRQSTLTARDITGATAEELAVWIAHGRPVVFWATLGFEPPKTNDSTWIIAETGEEYTPFSNLHCMVLYGYDEEFYYVCDPLFGLQTVSRETFKEQFDAMGNRAVILSAARADTPFLRDAP